MKYSNTTARAFRIIVASVLTLVGTVGTYGIANAATCATCHAPVGQGASPTDFRPVEEAFRNITTGSIKGSHAKHMPAATTNRADCAACHGPDVTTVYTNSHRNGFVNVTSATSVGYSKGTSFAQSGSQSPTLGTCSVASCHDNGKGVKVITPTWGATGIPACTACHALVPGDSHTQHVTNTTYKKAVCADCHTGYVQGTTAAANHINGTVEVNTGGYTSPKAKGSAFASCATSYCHSSGQAASGGAGLPVYAATAPTWGGAAVCGSCHATTSFSTGSHTKHLASSTDCGFCHTGAAAASYSSVNHVNGFINVSGSYNVKYSQTRSSAPGNGYGTCATTTCHNDGTSGAQVSTQTWGTALTACTACHAAAPATGSHSAHLGSGNHTPVCGDCHTSAVAGTSGGASHLDGSVNVATGLGYPTTITKHAAGSGYSSCSTTYCHSTGQAANGGAGGPVYATATWGNPASGACGTCHATTTHASGSHTKHLAVTTDCGVCHTGASATSYTSLNHVNGFVNVSGSYNVKYGQSRSTAPGNGYSDCASTTCHNNGTTSAQSRTAVWGVTVAACTACHAAAPATGSHSAHLGSSNHKPVCGDCHTSAVAGTSGGASHLDGSVNVATGLGYPTTIAKHAAGSGYSSCSTSYCHSTGQAASGGAGLPVYATATWNNPASGACGTCHVTTTLATGSHTKHLASNTNCGFCHTGAAAASYASVNHVDGFINVSGSYNVKYSQTRSSAPGNGYGTCATNTCHNDGTTGAQVSTQTWGTTIAACTACHAAVPATGAHTKHVTTTTFKKPVCGDCHSGAVAGTSGGAAHLNSTIDVDVATGYTQSIAKHSTASYTGSCSTVYCHSSGQGTADGVTALPTYAPIGWGTVGPLACNACHLSTNLASGSHAKHLASNTNCGNCHSGASVSAYNATTHVDGTIDVTAGLVYGAAGAPGNGYSTCTNAIACHDSGKGVAAITPVWGQNAPACSACHEVSPTTDSHAKHLTGLAVNFNRNALCADCHTGYVQGTTAAANHVNTTVEVNVGGYPSPKAKGSAFGSCTAAYCHSNGAATLTYKTATWGTPNAAGCNFCHDALPTTGSHTIHIGGGANYSFGCAECHGHNGTGTAHNNGVLNIVGTIAYNGSKQCTTSDCHSDGKATLTYKTTPVWGGSFTGDRCAACHGNSPTGGAHSAHAVAVAIHYDDVYNATGGKIAATGAKAGHGNPNYSTTISCNICHADTVSVGYNDKETSCGACHNGTLAPLKGSLTTASVNKANHVNRSRDVVFAGTTIRSKAQIRNDITTVTELSSYWSRTNSYKTYTSSHDASKATLLATAGYDGAGTCSTVVCHNGNSISWTSGAISCDKCHKALP